MKWDELSLDEKNELMKIFIKNGHKFKSIEDLKKKYELINSVNNRSNADFVNRLKDPERKTIPDWENKNNIATHKLSYAEIDGQNIVYPEVQNINGELYDYTDPKYKHGAWDGFDNAVRNGDTLHMSRKDAEWFTNNYKNYYPGFSEYRKGGVLDNDEWNKNTSIEKFKKDTQDIASGLKPAQNQDYNFNAVNTTPIELPPVTVTPASWQKEFMKVVPKDFRNDIYDKLTYNEYYIDGMIYDDTHYKMGIEYPEFPYEDNEEIDSIWRERIIKDYYNLNKRRAAQYMIDEKGDLYDRVNRLYNMYKASGVKKVKPIKTSNIIKKILDIRSNYDPFTKNINLESGRDIISEISHPLQFKTDKRSNTIINFFNSFKNLEDLWGGRTRYYDDPSHYEYRTHELVEPEVLDYIYLGKPGKRFITEEFINKNLNNKALGGNLYDDTDKESSINIGKTGFSTIDNIKEWSNFTKDILNGNHKYDNKASEKNVSRKDKDGLSTKQRVTDVLLAIGSIGSPQILRDKYVRGRVSNLLLRNTDGNVFVPMSDKYYNGLIEDADDSLDMRKTYTSTEYKKDSPLYYYTTGDLSNARMSPYGKGRYENTKYGSLPALNMNIYRDTIYTHPSDSSFLGKNVNKSINVSKDVIAMEKSNRDALRGTVDAGSHYITINDKDSDGNYNLFVEDVWDLYKPIDYFNHPFIYNQKPKIIFTKDYDKIVRDKGVVDLIKNGFNEPVTGLDAFDYNEDYYDYENE